MTAGVDRREALAKGCREWEDRHTEAIPATREFAEFLGEWMWGAALAAREEPQGEITVWTCMSCGSHGEGRVFRSGTEFEAAMFPEDVKRRQRAAESPTDAGCRCAQEALDAVRDTERPDEARIQELECRNQRLREELNRDEDDEARETHAVEAALTATRTPAGWGVRGGIDKEDR
jgi:hypothetical protein